MSPGLLDSVLRRLPRQTDPNVLVGFDTSDDAGVYQLTAELALVHTVDFFTPIVDDPRLYGQIAAANSLSDVYAMGGRPVSALSIVGFPEKGDPGLLEQILRGGLEKMIEAGCTVVGGHSVKDPELKFGYAVTGMVHPQRVWRNAGARPGDALLLTKPVGTGVITTALKNNAARAEWVAAAVASMARLNRDACQALQEADASGDSVHAVTDITGFGLLGHAREMAAGSGVSIEFDHAALPLLPGALEAAAGGFLAGGLRANREFVEGCVEFAADVSEEYRRVCYDPQTSGGLLAAVAESAAGAALDALEKRNVAAARIGRVTAKHSPLLRVG